MKIGIDISQLVYEKTGVANLLHLLIKELLTIDKKNDYIFFGSSLRRRDVFAQLQKEFAAFDNITWKIYPFPPSFLSFLWNLLHIVPIEQFIGNVDIFLSSDWTQPPTRKAKKTTILYDLVVYKFPNETHQKIVRTQKQRLSWVKKECDIIMCISEATRNDAVAILGIDQKKLITIYPGFTLW